MISLKVLGFITSMNKLNGMDFKFGPTGQKNKGLSWARVRIFFVYIRTIAFCNEGVCNIFTFVEV